MNKTVMIIIAVVIAIALAGGSFYGGMAYQNSRSSAARAAFLQGRGFTGTGNGQGANGTGTGTGNGFGGTVNGQIKSISGNTISLSTARNVTTVTMDTNTQIEKPTNATVSDLQTGDRVIILGQRDTSGNMTASQIVIIATP